ncbi:MAG: hypothetical protein LBU89_11540 [Fibromonadaceae bacterium]|jgi:hypothetical protein|nr:hypothetical protein [Fibromonadaceae bacterium]
MTRTILASVALVIVLASAAEVSPYGFVHFNGVWSDGVSGSANPSGVFVAEFSGEKASHSDFAASQTTLGINIRDSISNGRLILTGKFEGDFVNDYNLRLNHSFVNFLFSDIGLSILFGQSSALFVPYNPPTINYNKLIGAGNLYKERPQIRLTQKLGSTEIAAAARKDEGDYPAFEGRINTTTPIKIGSSVFWASESELPSWGIAADIFAPVGIVIISGEFFTGQNLSSYGGLSEPFYNNVKFKVKSIGGWGALGFKASDNLSFNTGVGAERITGEYWPSAPWLNGVVFANVSYKLKATTLTLEYYRHDTEYMWSRAVEHETGSYNRIETAVTYEF